MRVFGKVHVLCNNAGINLFGPMEQATYEDWDWVLAVNLGGVNRLLHLKKVHDDIGMDPMEVGRKVLTAIERNQLYIISHPEFKEDIRRRGEALLAAVPDETPDPRRVAIENTRPKLKY